MSPDSPPNLVRVRVRVRIRVRVRVRARVRVRVGVRVRVRVRVGLGLGLGLDSPPNPIISTLSMTGSASGRGGCSPRKLATAHTHAGGASRASQGASVHAHGRCA